MKRSVSFSAAQRLAAMNKVIIDNPRAREAHATFDHLIELRTLSPDAPKRCAALIGPSQTGKTTIIDTYISKMNKPEEVTNRHIRALKVTLRANITRKQFAQDVLEAIESYGLNTLVDKGTEAQLLRRVTEYLRVLRVEMLFLDEFQHLVHSDNRKVVMSVSETVKHLLLTGPCPIVVAGLEGAKKPFDSNPQLAHRAERHVDLSPLNALCEPDRDLFYEFLTDFLLKSEESGAGTGMTRLIEGLNPACILEVSQGVLGAACNLVKSAVHEAARCNRMEVLPSDLIAAADAAIRNGLYTRNPFRDGLAPIRRS